MPVTTAARADRPPVQARASLADKAGRIEPAQPRDVELRLAAGAYVWLDLEAPGDDQLRAFGDSLRLDADALEALREGGQRPSFRVVGGSIHAVVPAKDPDRPAGDILGVHVVSTERFLVTTHSEPCSALEAAHRRHQALPDDRGTDRPFFVFAVLMLMVDTFEPDLMRLDAQLDGIQVALLGRSSAGVRQQLMVIRRELSEAVKALGWYLGDLNHFVGAGQLPGAYATAGALLDAHRGRVEALREAAKDCREEAQDALAQVAGNVASRQGQVINILAVISAVFLPLTFITGYFGMNFGVITTDFNQVWQYAALGVALPAASVAVTLVLFRWLLRRMDLDPMLLRRPEPQGRRNADAESHTGGAHS